MKHIDTNAFNIPTKVLIPDNTDIIIVNDFFIEDLVGGAELTTEALIQSTNLNIAKLRSKQVTVELLQQFQQLHWVFANTANIDLNLLPTIANNIKYSVINFDYRFCKYRLKELHFESEKKKCDCANDFFGKLISTFMYQAESLWFMSEAQANIWFNEFPFLRDRNVTVLSSVFDENFFRRVMVLKAKLNSDEITKNNKYLVLGSTSWIKGTDDAIEYCEKNDLEFEVIAGLSYEKMLDKLAKSKGLVYLPRGGDTCPRLVIEAKLLGCDLILNNNVQHKDEEWFDTDDEQIITSYLYMARDRFWNGIKHITEYNPIISGYTTTRNCIEQNYPWKACITSLLDFCDEVIVVDGGSTDGTWEELQKLAKVEDKLLIKQFIRDWDHKRFAVFDGLQKALARSLCTGDFCWQSDVDEVVHEDSYNKIKQLVRDFPKNIALMVLPVIEYWGKRGKVRVDVHPWKWRLSRNLPHITHGIPIQHRRFDDDGDVYSLGSDGCDYIRSDTFEPINHATFYTPDVDQVRREAITDTKQLEVYENWLNSAIQVLPAIHHYSWFDVKRKIYTYKNYWSKHWSSLFSRDCKQIIDTTENNKFFDKPWSDVKDDEICDLSKRLEHTMGGWIFHEKIDFSKQTPSIKLNITHPSVLKDWIIKYNKEGS
ncbi:hypothetical protein CMI47_12665 [Candidatus Pacearchaeota archaeon]|nr:hypothetical protein [Candidatus Pacearchaeota archaeon]|tara:strand:- start:8220 stop:10181 length:1962 start_codon:yes stop_codon:yes gene_type:complete